LATFDFNKSMGYLKSSWALMKPSYIGWCVAYIPALIPGLVVNFMQSVRDGKGSGKAPQFADNLKFDNFVNKLIAVLLAGVCFPLFVWGPALLVEHPSMSGVNAFKASLAHGKKNFVANLLTCLVISIPVMVAVVGWTILCNVVFIHLTFLPSFIWSLLSLLDLAIIVALGPVCAGALWFAYEDVKAEVHSEAAAGGVPVT
jgi:hypothetical protein